ncbi:MAG: hypothetical protein JKX76_02245 [Colwellia sp.]|nr:hypothetical protein [Colwellia sp.]
MDTTNLEDQDTLEKTVHEIKELQFGLLSAEEILKNSVCCVKHHKIVDNGDDSIYDPRMGIMDNIGTCTTCNYKIKNCPGHFGHIELVCPVFHGSFVKIFIPKFLSCICFHCRIPLISIEQLELRGILDMEKSYRFKQIVIDSKKVVRCLHCKRQQPVFTECEKVIMQGYKKKKENSEKIPVDVQGVYEILSAIPDNFVTAYGFDVDNMHPRNMIITILPVLPPRSRPPVLMDDGLREDHVTTMYIEIIKANNKLKKHIEDGTTPDKKKKSLFTYVSALCDTSANKSGDQLSLAIRLRGKEGMMRQHLMGKRVDFSGRTVIGPDSSLRTDQVMVPPEMYKVLTKPVTVNYLNINKIQHLVDTNEVAYIKRNDRRQCIKYAVYKSGTRLFTGDILVRGGKNINILTTNKLSVQEGDSIIRNNEEIPVEYPVHTRYIIQIGDTAEVYLQNGDFVVINRQPSLHRGSIMGVRVVRGKPGTKTMRISLGATTPFNADFDGDEMNLHVPQNIKADVECQEMLSTHQNIISDQSSKPMIFPVQDAILGSHLMTKCEDQMPEATFNNLCMRIVSSVGAITFVNGTITPSTNEFNISNRIQEIIDVHNEAQFLEERKQLAINEGSYTNDSNLLFTKQNILNGRGIISMIIPNTFLFQKNTKVHPDYPVLEIYKGVVIRGGFNKSCLGSSHNSIIQLLYKEYTTQTCLDFIDNIQYITNGWLLYYGFSIHLGDTLPKNLDQVDEEIEKALIKANEIENNIINPFIREVKIIGALSQARDLGMKISQDVLDPSNNIKIMVNGGSKGSNFNIAQIMGDLGQQNVGGQRAPKTFNRGTRTSTHYPHGELSIDDKYESQGFVKDSFARGLRPKQQFRHAQVGREGVCDTANKTSESGYTQRRMVKIMEDIKIHHDGTVRNSLNTIIQFKYGDDGSDNQQLLRINEELVITNVLRSVAKLKLQHKMRLAQNL